MHERYACAIFWRAWELRPDYAYPPITDQSSPPPPPPRRQTPPPPLLAVTCYVSLAAGTKKGKLEMGCMHTLAYTWVYMHTDCYLYTANNTSETEPLVQCWLNVAPTPGRWHDINPAFDPCLII